MLACRLCRIDISATTGCSVCDPLRRNLVVAGDREDERPSLAGTGNEALVAIRKQVDHHKSCLSNNPNLSKHESGLIACTNALAKLVGELRKLQDDGAKTVEAMSFEERAKLFVGWYMDLAPAYRQHLRERMADHEVHVSKPIEDTGVQLS